MVGKPITNWDDVPVVMDLAMVARIIGRSPEYLKKLAQRGEFPAFKEGSSWRVEKSALMRRCGVTGDPGSRS